MKVNRGSIRIVCSNPSCGFLQGSQQRASSPSIHTPCRLALGDMSVLVVSGAIVMYAESAVLSYISPFLTNPPSQIVNPCGLGGYWTRHQNRDVHESMTDNMAGGEATYAKRLLLTGLGYDAGTRLHITLVHSVPVITLTDCPFQHDQIARFPGCINTRTHSAP